MLKRIAAAGIVAGIVAGVASAGLLLPMTVASAATTTVSAQDTAFLRGATATDLAEISLGKVALAKATTPESKRYAARMIKDHTKMLADHRIVGSAWHISLPTAPTPAQKATAKLVSAQSGIKFDAAYLAAQVTSHRLALADGVKELRLGSNARVKGQAVDGSPMIRYHLWLGGQYLLWVVKASGRGVAGPPTQARRTPYQPALPLRRTA